MVAHSPEPGAHVQTLDVQIKLKFDFVEGGKPEKMSRKPQSGVRTN